MGYAISRNQTTVPLVFFMQDSTSTRTLGKTGLSPTVTISKNGGTFASPAGAVTEIGDGLYKVAPNATDSNTLGPLELKATATGADQCITEFLVVAYDPFAVASLGLTNLDTTIGSRSAPGDQMALTAGERTTLLGVFQAAGTYLKSLYDGLSGRYTKLDWLDNLNIGGPVASNADILAINQSASRRIVVACVGQMERPETGSNTFTVEVRTYTGDGAATDADATPTIVPQGKVSGSLAANLSAVTRISAGLYRATYTVASGATLEEIRFDASATLSTEVFTLSAYSQAVDFVAANFSATDRANLVSAASDAAAAKTAAQAAPTAIQISDRVERAGGPLALTQTSAASADGKLTTNFTNMVTRFLTMIESYGAGNAFWRFITGALSQAPTGSSGGSAGKQLIHTPLRLVLASGEGCESCQSDRLNLTRGSKLDVRLNLVDTDGIAVPTTGTTLTAKLTTMRGMAIVSLASGSVVETLGSEGQLTVSLDTSLSALAGINQFKLVITRNNGAADIQSAEIVVGLE